MSTTNVAADNTALEPPLHAGTHSRPASIFRNRSFVALWLGQFIAFLGNNVYTLALLWEMKVLTGSTVMMSAVAIASLVPTLVFGPVAGVLVDRWPKRTAMIWSDVIRAAVIGALTVLLAAHVVTPWMLIAGSAVNSLVSSVYSPANAALVPLLVGRDNLQQANSVSQGTMVLTQIIGPFVGGTLVAHVSIVAAFAANAATYLASVLSLLLVQHREPAREHKKLDVRQFVAEFKEGLDAILRMKLIRQVIPVALIANFLFAPFELILLQYCTEVLGGDAQLFGTLGACFSFGMLCGALAAGALARKVRRGILITVSFPMFTAMMFILSFTRTIWLALTLAVLMGFFNMMVNILLMTIIQAAIPQDKMGRVFGTFGLLIQGSQPFAQALGGYLLTVFSVPALMATLSGLCFLDALWAATMRELRAQE
jgi:DHA3 family macrolide efflux protein-like MFS transporter